MGSTAYEMHRLMMQFGYEVQVLNLVDEWDLVGYCTRRNAREFLETVRENFDGFRVRLVCLHSGDNQPCE